jgi:hypothetical protein
MKAVKIILKYQLVVLFAGLLFLPILNSQLEIWQFERRDENRNFSDTLNFNIANLDEFPGESEVYLNDNFSFRTPLLDIYHHIKFSYFQVSPHPEKTIVGDDGWFFMSGKEKEIYEGALDFSEQQLRSFTHEWQRRKRYLDSLDIEMYWVIAPFKHNVYPELLPFSVHRSEPRRVDILKHHFADYLPNLIIDPVPAMMAAKDSTKFFYKMDNHWNFRAGFLATELLFSSMKKDFPAIEIPVADCEWQDTTVSKGIHYRVIGVDRLSEIRQLARVRNPKATEIDKYGFPGIPGFAYPWEYERRYTNTTLESGLTVLFIRDSFCEQMIPFLKEAFSESVFIFDSWQYNLDREILEKVKPDAVVFIGLETHLEAIIAPDSPEKKPESSE